MTKKYNPKQTVENILATAHALFTTKGYEKTSMQDIVEALGMSKGAVFHHFKSKEDILDAVMNQQYGLVEAEMRGWFAELSHLTAKEKIQALLLRNISDVERMKAFNTLAINMLGSPQLILGVMQGNYEKSAPVLAEVFREGMEDGSITTDFPVECAEVFLLLYNIWCDTFIFEADFAAVHNRLLFLQQMMRNMGADIMTDEIVEASLNVVKTLNLEVVKWNQTHS